MEIQTKYFTPAEATKTLPLVRKIVSDILNISNKIKLKAKQQGIKVDEDPVVKKMIDELRGYFQEIEDIGCYYKDWDFSIGLVDFPSVINGEEVFLCWRSDEDKITWYHPLDKGFTARKPLPEEFL
jgi:hypothetical protein